MCAAREEKTGATFVDLEFGTGTNGASPLGDIASSLVSLDELLRDLGSIAAYPSSVEFRRIEIVAIETRSPLKIRLSLFAIPAVAVTAFQDICRDIICNRDRKTVREIFASQGEHARITEQEAQRLQGHIVALQNAEVRLKRVEIKEE